MIPRISPKQAYMSSVGEGVGRDSLTTFAAEFFSKEIDIMALRSVSKPVLKAPMAQQAGEEPRPADQEEQQRPRNTPPNKFPVEGFSVEVDGKIKSQHDTEAAALKAGS